MSYDVHLGLVVPLTSFPFIRLLEAASVGRFHSANAPLHRSADSSYLVTNGDHCRWRNMLTSSLERILISLKRGEHWSG